VSIVLFDTELDGSASSSVWHYYVETGKTVKLVLFTKLCHYLKAKCETEFSVSEVRKVELLAFWDKVTT